MEDVFKELFGLSNGSTDNKILKAQNVKIWNDNASREYLDSIGLTNREEDDLSHCMDTNDDILTLNIILARMIIRITE